MSDYFERLVTVDRGIMNRLLQERTQLEHHRLQMLGIEVVFAVIDAGGTMRDAIMGLMNYSMEDRVSSATSMLSLTATVVTMTWNAYATR